MTRKKSNVKALALAVTCAILAGGYSGLNPVYAADDYTVKYDATENCLDYVKQNSAGGYNTYGISKIKLNNIVLDSSIGTSPSITVGSYFSIDGSGGSINAANGKFTVSGAGAITATSLKLGSDYDVKEKIDKINLNPSSGHIGITLKNAKDKLISTIVIKKSLFKNFHITKKINPIVTLNKGPAIHTTICSLRVKLP